MNKTRKLKKNRREITKHRKTLKIFKMQKGGDDKKTRVTLGPSGISGEMNAKTTQHGINQASKTTLAVVPQVLKTSERIAAQFSPQATAKAILSMIKQSRQSGNTQATQAATNARQRRISEMNEAIKQRMAPVQQFGPTISGVSQPFSLGRLGTIRSGYTSSGYTSSGPIVTKPTAATNPELVARIVQSGSFQPVQSAIPGPLKLAQLAPFKTAQSAPAPSGPLRLPSAAKLAKAAPKAPKFHHP